MPGLLIILPLTACVLTMLALRRAGMTWRVAMMLTAVLAGVWVAVSTETLSAAGLLSRWGLVGIWAIACVAAAVALLVTRSREVKSEPTQREPFGIYERLMGAMLLLILAVTFVTAISSVPNTWDSMTYHLPRVMHWWQNGSVEHYPTSISRQLYQPPLAEFALLHIFGLTGADRGLNLLQWVALGITLVAVSSITQHLGGSRRAQLLAAIIAATIPSAILQASNTKNTLVLTMWLAVSLALMLAAQRPNARAKGATLLASGIAMGLAVLTHGMALFLVLPLGVWWLIVAMRISRRRAILPVVAALLLAFAMNSPHWMRNARAFDHPLGDSTADYRNTTFGPGTLLSNLVRSLTLHAATPWEDTNEHITASVSAALSVVGIDANDPGTTWGGVFLISPRVLNEDYAPAPLHVLLLAGIAAVLIVELVRRKRITHRDALVLAVVLLVQLLLFCVILRWQVWHTRLHLPLLMLACPVIAAVVGQRLKERAVLPLAAVLTLASLPWLVWNQTRPLLGQDNVRDLSPSLQYFNSWPPAADRYLPAVEALKQQPWTHLGLVVGEDSYEYPLWRLLVLPRGAKLTHETIGRYDADSPPRDRGATASAPEGLLLIEVELPGEVLVCRGHVYRAVWIQPGIAIFWRVDVLADTGGSPSEDGGSGFTAQTSRESRAVPEQFVAIY